MVTAEPLKVESRFSDSVTHLVWHLVAITPSSGAGATRAPTSVASRGWDQLLFLLQNKHHSASYGMKTLLTQDQQERGNKGREHYLL